MRYRSLLFRTWEMFRSWYADIKERFTTLKLVFVKSSPGYSAVRIVVTY